MKASEFQTRLRAALPEIPPDLDFDPGEFVVFDEDVLASSELRPEDRDFLLEAGMPCSSAPFLDFHAHALSRSEVEKLRMVLPEGSYFPIGFNNYGDIIVIDCPFREVVYFNHDFDNLRVFINSSLETFAESLCVYRECLTTGVRDSCLAIIPRLPLLHS